MTANMREALEAAKEFIAEGIETDGPTEAEHSIYARGLVAKIDAALSAVPAPVSEALEAAERYMSIVVKRIAEIAPDEDAGPQADIALQEYMRAKAALSAVPAPVSEEEIADIICNCFNGDMTFNECAKLVISRLSRTEGEFPAPVSEEEIARGALEAARSSWYRNPSFDDAINAAIVHVLSRLSRTEGDTEESIRTRLDEQAVKSSGGVRTSTGKE